jgi:hypothetical protein
MKLVKLIAVTLLVSTPGSAFAVGKMEKDEVREGQMICLGNGSGLKEGRNLAVVNPKAEEDRSSQNNSAN